MVLGACNLMLCPIIIFWIHVLFTQHCDIVTMIKTGLLRRWRRSRTWWTPSRCRPSSWATRTMARHLRHHFGPSHTNSSHPPHPPRAVCCPTLCPGGLVIACGLVLAIGCCARLAFSGTMLNATGGLQVQCGRCHLTSQPPHILPHTSPSPPT